jgi:uncharacterized membrane protein HdeD (DUF308 family)
MATFFHMTWVTLLGISLLFVGGFVLWVYGTHVSHKPIDTDAREAEATHKFHSYLVQWFFLYGIIAIIVGVACLLTAAAEML